MVTTDKYYTVKEAAALTGHHPETIKEWIRKGAIEANKWPEGAKTGKWYIPDTEIPTFLRKNS